MMGANQDQSPDRYKPWQLKYDIVNGSEANAFV